MAGFLIASIIASVIFYVLVPGAPPESLAIGPVIIGFSILVSKIFGTDEE